MSRWPPCQKWLNIEVVSQVCSRSDHANFTRESLGMQRVRQKQSQNPQSPADLPLRRLRFPANSQNNVSLRHRWLMIG